MFAFYCQHFDTVEVNNSFYRLPEAATFAAWRDSAPEGFLFSVKGSRYLTHAKKLKEPAEAIERLLTHADALQEKLGPVLFQLPPQWTVNVKRFEQFLAALPPGRYAFEFRNPTWDTPAIYDLLHRFNAAHCIYHLAGYLSPLQVTADFAYLRLHGPGGKYQGTYSDADLCLWAQRIRRWMKRLQAVYVYFDNDEAGYAVHDAARLRQLISA